MNVAMRQQSKQTPQNAPSTGALLQRKCGCGGTCGSCGSKDELQRSARVDAPPPVHDFTNVRVHGDSMAASAEPEVHALAEKFQ